MKQLPLKLQLRDEARFENFYTEKNNQASINHLQKLITTKNPQFELVYLFGPIDCGRTHLLQACCYLAEQQNSSTFYFSLKDHKQFTPDILENVENFSLVALDDIDYIIGNPAWEEAIFHLYNRIQMSKTLLIITALAPPAGLKLQLKDLHSRLAAGLILQIIPLNENEKIAALKLRAKNRGLSLSNQTIAFLLNHFQRNMTALYNILEKLDQLSLSEKRKLTVPFIKKML